MTKYTFSLNSNPSTFRAPKYKSTDYSKILDDLINDDIKDKNPWLFTNTPKNSNAKIILSGKSIEDEIIDDASDNNYMKACAFLNMYSKITCPYKKDTVYYLADGTPFEFTDDYITIGFDTYYFYKFNDISFINALSPKTKKIIATIYIDGLKITIKK